MRIFKRLRSILISSSYEVLPFLRVHILRGITRGTSLRCNLPFFFTRNKDGHASAFGVLFAFSYNEAKCRRVYRDAIIPRVFLSTEVRRCTCAHSYYRSCLEKAMLEKCARCTFIVFSPDAASATRRRDPESNGESITRRSVASRRR